MRPFADGAVVEKLAKLKQQDKSLWQKIKDCISDLVAKIRRVYEGLSPDSVEGRYVAEMKDSLAQLQKLFTEGLVEASGNFQTSHELEEAKAEAPLDSGDDVLYSRRRKSYAPSFFPGNVFPSGEVHSLAIRWASDERTKIKDRKLAYYGGHYYMIEAFDDMEFGYLVMKKYTKNNYKEAFEEYGTLDERESLQGEFDQGIAHYRAKTPDGRGRHRTDSSESGYGREDRSFHGVDAHKAGRRNDSGETQRNRESSGGNRRGDNGSSVSEPKLSDRAYMEAVKIGDSETALPKTEAEIAETEVAQADRDLEAVEDVRYSLRGVNKDGIEVYETSEEVKKLSYKERQRRFLEIMTNEYRGKTARFVRNGHEYFATFDEKDVNKNIYGDHRSDTKGWKAKINVGADGDIFDLVENAQYVGSKAEKGKKIAAHRGVGYWDYFVKTVQIDNTVFDMLANVRKKADGAFVYSIQLVENKKMEASPPLGSLLRASSGVTNASGGTISQPDSDVKRSDRASDGTQLSAKQQSYFRNSKMRDEQGRLLVMYHGTNTPGFTVFNPKKSDDGISLFFTDSTDVADSYKDSEGEEGRYSVFLNLTNPYIVDAGKDVSGMKSLVRISRLAKDRWTLYMEGVDGSRSTQLRMTEKILYVDKKEPHSWKPSQAHDGLRSYKDMTLELLYAKPRLLSSSPTDPATPSPTALCLQTHLRPSPRILQRSKRSKLHPAT